MQKLGHVLLAGFGADHDSVSGKLVLLNYRPLRADNLFEARNACAEPGRTVRAVLLHAGLRCSADEVAALRAHAPDGCQLVVVGPQLDEAGRDAWRRTGVALALWTPFVDGELRFVLNEATNDPAQWATRADPRVPTPLMALVHSATGQKAALVYNVSVSGAYLETPRPTASGGHVALELPLPTGTLELEAAVVSSNVPGNLQRPNLPMGMGVRFLDLEPAARADLEAYVEERRRAYRL